MLYWISMHPVTLTCARSNHYIAALYNCYANIHMIVSLLKFVHDSYACYSGSSFGAITATCSTQMELQGKYGNTKSASLLRKWQII